LGSGSVRRAAVEARALRENRRTVTWIDAARRRLLDGEPIAQVAAGVDFYDQAHFTSQFKRHLGTPPGRYVRSAMDEPAADSAAADGAASSHSS
jgi:AraC-like DNA-binding protein